MTYREIIRYAETAGYINLQVAYSCLARAAKDGTLAEATASYKKNAPYLFHRWALQ